MPFHTKCLNNLKSHLGMEKQPVKSLLFATSRDHTANENIEDLMEESDMFCKSQSDDQLKNPFTGIPATPEQTHDLLNFQLIGQTEFEDHVSYCILHTPSADAPRRCKRLQIFGSTKRNKRKLKQIERDRKIQKTCMKKQLVVLACGEKLPADCGSYFIQHPCALSDHDGLPHKGKKNQSN